MPPPVFRYDFLKAAFQSIGIHHLELLPNGHVRWGDRPLVKGESYKGLSLPTAPITEDPVGKSEDAILFDFWTVQAILSKFGKTMAEFVEVYFGNRKKG